jgi:hypothetical protein
VAPSVNLTREQRRLRASAAAHVSWAKTADPAARTAPARQAFAEKFADQIDPNHELPPEERARRGEQARRAYYKLMALKSSKAPAARRSHPTGAGTRNRKEPSPPRA